METFTPEIIGTGYKVTVETTPDERVVIKRYSNPNVFDLAEKQIMIHTRIQKYSHMFDKFQNVKIPKLLGYEKSETEIILRFERVHNYLELPKMSHVHISNETKIVDFAGRGKTFQIPYFEHYVGHEKICDYIRELGIIIALLNYQCQIRLHDIEFVMGQGETTPILYILDFDRCDICKIDKILELRETSPLMEAYDYGLLKIREYIDLGNLSSEYVDIFVNAYTSESLIYGIPERLIEAALNTLKRW